MHLSGCWKSGHRTALLHVQCINALISLLKQSVENCVCILHNLTFHLEAEAPTLFSRITALAKTMNRRNSQDDAGPLSCFTPQSKSPEQEVRRAQANALMCVRGDLHVCGIRWKEAIKWHVAFWADIQKVCRTDVIVLLQTSDVADSQTLCGSVLKAQSYFHQILCIITQRWTAHEWPALYNFSR